MTLVVLVLFLSVLVTEIRGHGYMIEPPGRSSAWLKYPNNFAFSPNYNHNALYCGGQYHHQIVNEGKCGICGDPWDQPQPRDNEANGIYAAGVSVQNYQTGQQIRAEIVITAQHLGYFVFDICVHNDYLTPANETCFEPLPLPDGSTKYYSPYGSISEEETYFVDLVLPSGVECTQCIIRWRYFTANSPGYEPEMFYACADVEISNSNPLVVYSETLPPATTTTSETTTATTSTTTTPTTTTTQSTTSTTTPVPTTTSQSEAERQALCRKQCPACSNPELVHTMLCIISKFSKACAPCTRK